MRTLALHELHRGAAATFTRRGDWEVPETYCGTCHSVGEAVGLEYRSARTGAAVADLSDRAVLAVSGPLRQKFLHNILSNEIAALKPGQGRRAALMDVKGHLLAFLRALVTGDSVLLETGAAELQPLHDKLVHYKVAAPVRFQPLETVVLGLLGPEAAAVLARAGAEVPALAAEDHLVVKLVAADVRVARAGDLPCQGLVLHVPPAAAEAAWEALKGAGAAPLGRLALDALRIEEGRAWYGPDVTADNLLHETGLVSEYHADKGCYVGQEVVARLEARGSNVNRRLRGLVLTAPVLPGLAVEADQKAVGRVTSASISPRHGDIAMAYVHRSHAEPGTRLRVDGAQATVVELPFER